MSPAVADAPKPLVSTNWLAAHIKDPDLWVLDASWYLPTMGRDAKAEYAAGHITGARFFDIDDISDQRSELPHMMPPVEKFISRLRAIGVGDGHQVVVYDVADGHKTTKAPPTIRDRHMTVTAHNDMVKDVTQVARAAKLGDYVVIDARAADRFEGRAEEPREGMRSGHIPGSRNVHYATLLNADGTMKPADTLRQIFIDAGVDLQKPAIITCGSGVVHGPNGACTPIFLLLLELPDAGKPHRPTCRQNPCPCGRLPR